jgi:L-cysteine/cystine lyase
MGSEAEKLDEIRDQLPALKRIAFLNTGSCGPMPRVVADSMAEAARHEFEQGRANVADYIAFQDVIQQVRAAQARLFGVGSESIALTHNTTEGMNIITWGIEWQPGDEIVTTTLEHEGSLYALYMVKMRRGIVLRFADVGNGADPLPAIERAFSSRTRLLVISHVSYSSGTRFPLEEIVDLAHDRGVMVAVDGAQSAGAFALDLRALNVDFYAISGQKWLCGPEGTGALYVRSDRLADLQPTYVGYNSFKSQDWRGYFLPTPGAARFSTAAIYRPGVIGQLASLNWFQETVDPSWAYGRIDRMAGRCRELLQDLDEVRILTPADRQAGLVNFILQGWSPRRMTALVPVLLKHGYLIRPITHEPYCLRVSVGFFNTEQELAGLRNALGELLAAGPGAVEIPESTMLLPDKPLWAEESL